MKRFLYTLIQWTWGFPQNFVGLLMFIGCKIAKCKSKKYKNAIETKWDNKYGSVSLGMFIFLDVAKKMPPTRLCRYCCAELKEGGGKGRICITGVRKAESVNRKLNGGEVKIINGVKAQKTMIDNKIEGDFDLTPKGGIVMNLDNNENRRLVEQCYRTNKTIVNPIIDWTDEDIWEFSKAENIQQSGLYKQCGGRYNRLGCIGCPMASLEEKLLEFAEYPKIKQAYINAFDRMVKNYGDKSAKFDWYDGQAVFDWWLYGDKNTADDNQLSMQELIDNLQVDE